MRETGPVSKVLARDDGGDHSDTKPYIGPARTLLGMLKNQMQFLELDQGKLTRTLPNGVSIVVESRFGQDKVTIIAPSPKPKRPGKKDYPIEALEFEVPDSPVPPLEIEALLVAACGQCTVTSGFAQAAVWVTLHSTPSLICEDMSRTSEAMAVSDDGSTVVGNFTPPAGGSTQAFRWTARNGVEELSVAGHPSGATAVSASGNTVGGFCTTTGRVPFVWTEGVSSFIPDVAAGTVTCISPSGDYVAGTETVPTGPQAPQAAWVAHRLPSGFWLKRQIDNPGTTSRDDTPTASIDNTRPDTYTPVNVDDRGWVTLRDNHQVGETSSMGERYWPFHDSGMPNMTPFGDPVAIEGKFYLVSPLAEFQANRPADWGVHRYQWTGGLLTTLTAGAAARVADDVNVVIGADVFNTRGVLVSTVPGRHLTAEDGTHLADIGTVETTKINYYDGALDVTRSWWWTARRGRVYLQPDESVVTDISEDGLVIVGYIWSDDTTSVRLPAYWLRGRGANAVRMPYVGFTGYVNSVARPRIPKVSIVHENFDVRPPRRPKVSI